MKRPELPHKKAMGYIGLALVCLLLVTRIGGREFTMTCIWMGLATLFLLYIAVQSFRQRCYGYGVVALVVPAVGWIAIIALNQAAQAYVYNAPPDASAAPATASGLSNVAQTLFWIVIGAKVLFDIFAITVLLLRKRYPELGAQVRKIVWPVIIASDFLALGLALVWIYA